VEDTPDPESAESGQSGAGGDDVSSHDEASIRDQAIEAVVPAMEEAFAGGLLPEEYRHFSAAAVDALVAAGLLRERDEVSIDAIVDRVLAERFGTNYGPLIRGAVRLGVVAGRERASRGQEDATAMRPLLGFVQSDRRYVPLQAGTFEVTVRDDLSGHHFRRAQREQASREQEDGEQ
jgi:hypothetical protein